MYSTILRQHAQNPKNRGLLETANAHGHSSYPPCGDHFSLQLEVEGDIIRRAAFQAKACGPVIAMGSFGTELLQGLPVEQARQINCFELDEKLGGLPPAKRHCILLFLDCVHQALQPFAAAVASDDPHSERPSK